MTQDETLIELIETTRSHNNVNWMTILRIAMEHAPAKTRGILRDILAKDADIHHYLSKLANED